jgi:hypothetical protein
MSTTLGNSRSSELLKLRKRASRGAAGLPAAPPGDRTVSEITHEGTRSVYIQVWRGSRRPDLFIAKNPRAAGVSAEDWLAVRAWRKRALSAAEFGRRDVASHVTAAAAQDILADRIRKLHRMGLAVINQVPPSC